MKRSGEQDGPQISHRASSPFKEVFFPPFPLCIHGCGCMWSLLDLLSVRDTWVVIKKNCPALVCWYSTGNECYYFQTKAMYPKYVMLWLQVSALSLALISPLRWAWIFCLNKLLVQVRPNHRDNLTFGDGDRGHTQRILKMTKQTCRIITTHGHQSTEHYCLERVEALGQGQLLRYCNL